MKSHRDLVLPVVQGLLDNGGHVLLGKRGERPYIDCWDMPGGVVEINEDLVSALIREYKEETGLEVINAVLKDVFHYPGNGGSRAVFVLFTVTSYAGSITTNPEFPQLKFFSKKEIKTLDLTPWSKYFLSS
ncbi:MAG: NUDIX hydrolase [Candidatus Bathyarchaeia archaeon]